MLRATRNNKFDELVNAILCANSQSLEKCHISINNNTEAYLVHKLAEHFYTNFKNLTYRFEVSPKEILEQTGLSESQIYQLHLKKSHLRINGFIDCCLYQINTFRPAHLLEFKRGKGFEKMYDDLIRLAGIIREVRKFNNKRGKTALCNIETAYFATTTKFSDKTSEEQVNKCILSKLERANKEINKRRMGVDILYQVFYVGVNKDSKNLHGDKHVWGLVAELRTSKV